jgi:hypothetical protein
MAILPKRRHSLQNTTAKGTAFAEQVVFAFEIPTLHRAELGNRIGQVKMQHQFGPYVIYLAKIMFYM